MPSPLPYLSSSSSSTFPFSSFSRKIHAKKSLFLTEPPESPVLVVGSINERQENYNTFSPVKYESNEKEPFLTSKVA